MNFLAHIFLSGDDEQIQIGNFMADGIRGRDYEQFPAGVRRGILLHRAIDTFTDSHPIFRRGTKRLHARYHHYASVIMDVFYDHFLAKNWTIFHDQPLAEYAAKFYRALDANLQILTPRAQHMLPYMKSQNWLVSYASVEGISGILANMDRRTKNHSVMQSSVEELKQYYTLFEEEFLLFFEELRSHAAEFLAADGTGNAPPR